MKKFLSLVAATVLASCSNAVSTDKTLMVKSQGKIEALPDKATFQVALHCLDKSVETSKQCLVDKSNALIARLKSMGVEAKDIRTTAVNLEKSYTWQNNSSVFEGFRSTTTLIVTVKKIKSLAEIYTQLLGDPNLELHALAFDHSDVDSLENEAYLMALKKSERLADKLLEKLPEDEKEILKIGNVEITSSAPEAKRMMRDATTEQAAPVANQSIGISPGILTVNATLYVEYAIR